MPTPQARPEYHPRRPKFSKNFPVKKRFWVRPNRADRQANKRRRTKQVRSPQLRTEKAVKYDRRSMLEAIRRYQYSWVVKLPFAVLALVMTFWGFGMGMFNRIHPVASVNGNQILGDQVDREATNLRQVLQQMYGAGAASALKGINIRQEALDRLIEGQLISDEARHLGISISDEALQQKIATTAAFQRDGQFDFETYNELLRGNNLQPSEYENGERRQMIADLMRNMFNAGVQVSDDEARHAYNLRNEKVGLRYVEIAYSDFSAKIAPTENQVADFYKKNAEQFREPARVKITFIHYSPLALAAKYAPTDNEIQDFYKRNSKMFNHPEQAHARHILLAVPAGATDTERAKAKAKAADVLKQAQAGGDFAKLAVKYSEDPSNKLEGGDLGTFGHNGQMIKPFEDAVFAMKPGQVTMVETRFGFHVVKLDELKPAHNDTLAEAQPKIIETLRTQAGAKLARDATREDLASALNGGNLQELAKKRGLDAVETPLFAENEPIKGAEGDRELTQSAFKLEPGQTRIVPEKGAPYLVKLIGREPSRIPPLKEIEARVRDALVRSTAEADAGNQANKMLATIKSPAGFDQGAAGDKP